ncbi:glycosyl transferase, family 2 [Fimbriiglobus ruber]|uniref:Glycosyl transferase, family 2 n=2 Tax=Fimbriiglobus ruber TaxID=1908690 RepID=A0A225DWK8_9BACT|nr:glycosyl transferase, family 2 [Fimbriiglobus ruber]
MPDSVLTFAIPYYRGDNYIGRAIASVLTQRDARWRLLVCDGGEERPGPPRGLPDGYRDDRIRYIPPAGKPGMAENWNRCLRAAETDLVTLLHEDDELEPDYAGRMIAAAAAHPGATLLFCNASIIGPKGEPLFSFPDYVKRFFRPARGLTILRGEVGLRAIMRGNFIMCPTMCFRRSHLAGRAFDPQWRQVLDLDLTARLLLDGDTLVGIPESLYRYRRHEENATAAQTKNLLRFREEWALFRDVARRARARGWDRAAAAAASVGIVKLNLLYCAFNDLLASRGRGAVQKLRLLAEIAD